MGAMGEVRERNNEQREALESRTQPDLQLELDVEVDGGCC
jgi:hypothetical protein